VKRLRFEMLYPEVANLYGDTQNLRYLSLCVPQADIIRTGLNDVPAFAGGLSGDRSIAKGSAERSGGGRRDGRNLSERPDLIYLGPMTERGQCRVVERLLPYRQHIAELIAEGVVFLFVGNALEVLGELIRDSERGVELRGLGLLPLRSELALFDRFNGKVLGEFEQRPARPGEASPEPLGIVGFKSQFSQVEGDNSHSFFLRCQRGAGLNRQSRLEGVRVNNFFGTSLLGPLLILNPLFTRYLHGLFLPEEEPALAFEPQIMQAYRERLREFKDSRTEGFDGKGH
jgi:CobQ-like glutamine amidotransferase family enzyme